MTHYYVSEITGKIMTDYLLNTLLIAFMPEKTIDDLITEGRMRIIEEPNVIDCLRNGSLSIAIIRYKELHPECKSVKDAQKMVFRMREDMKRFGKKNTAEKPKK